jgi:hypothetical protein
MPSKSLLRRGFKAESERLSEKYRAELGLSKFAPLNAFALADHLEIPVFTVSDVFPQVPNSPADILNDTAKFSAMWMPNEEGDKVIIHNDNHSEKRQQSNIMHELAHIIQKHEIPLEAAKLCHIYNLHYYNKEHEQEAKYLGACLQITRSGLQWALKENLTEVEISDYYKASVDMVRFRLNTSGVLIQRGNYS